jgi:PPK2 family polyphosphate:nucleotide phosphotransferase
MDDYRIKPGKRLKLKRFDPDDTGGYELERDRAKIESKTRRSLERIATEQNKLFAGASKALLIVVQAMDGAGKDSLIKHVMGSVLPQGVQNTYFKAPSTLEKSHDYLWRIHQACPPRGLIGIFNRSHYEEVLITRVHGWINDKTAKQRFAAIRDFEQMLTDNGTTILKFYLNISKEEQRLQLQERIDDPTKRWKFNPGDLDERKLWDDYMRMYEEAITETSTDFAPWYVVPSNRRWYRNMVVSAAIADAMKGMKLEYPTPNPDVNWATLRVE